MSRMNGEERNFAIEPQIPISRFGTSKPNNSQRSHSHQRSSSSNPPRTRSREREPSQNALNSFVLPAESQGGILNRWSKSTEGSSAAGHTHKRSSSFSRRISFVGNSFLDTSPPRKLLQKTRSPAAISPKTQIRTTRQPSIDSALINLPPIDTLPELKASLTNSSPSVGPATPSPSTAQILSAAAHSVDYFGRFEDSSFGPKDFSHQRASSTSRSTNLGPSPILAPYPEVKNHTFHEDDEGEGEGGRPISRGHSRHRSQAGKSSTGTNSSSRSSKQPSQKAMLSKALQKANTAVLLDNAQNFEGAMQAYSEACTLLQQVMQRSSGDDDRRKLEAIRNTYTSRISELRKIAPQLYDDGKALPARPESGFRDEDSLLPIDDDEAIIETATMARIINDNSYVEESPTSRSLTTSKLPQRRESLVPSGLEILQYRQTNEQYYGRSYSKSPMRDYGGERNLGLAPPMETMYMPPPLSPRRPSLPLNYEPARNTQERQPSEFTNTKFLASVPMQGHTRVPSNESMSWLDTIDESGGSTNSSIHSHTSSLAIRRKHIRAPSGETEAEFDAALDAAVEAAYDDGFEPMDTPEPIPYDYEDEDGIVTNVRRKVELAKERVRQTEREAAIQDARDRERRRLLFQQQQRQETVAEDEYDGNESEEEERMLEEMTRGYVLDDFEFGLQSKSALPRESDSSGFSGRTWHSSLGSNPTTAGTMLSSVVGFSSIVPQPLLGGPKTSPRYPPPAHALPPPPPSSTGSIAPMSSSSTQSVRSRRLSGQNAKALKIETTVKMPIISLAPLSLPPSMPPPRLPVAGNHVPPQTAGFLLECQDQILVDGITSLNLAQSARLAASPFPNSAEVVLPPTPTLFQTVTNDSESNSQFPRSGSPGRTHSRAGLRKNFSSSSLKNLKGRNLSVSNLDDGGSDVSPNTPLSSQFASRDARLPAMPTLPTPIALAFKDKMNGIHTGGMYLFDGDIYSPDSPGPPSLLNASAPIPLEPCPTEYLLRPFWLMRAMYQTIAHPRGGYLSTKLFVPRDVWRVKGVKIKGLEDKVAQCDFLTASLMKLAQVDPDDADAVLEEMQALETVLEQVQATLTKKLGNEVGMQGSGGMFKDAPTADTDFTNNIASKTGSVTSKSSSFSWRRLRSKNSGVGMSSTYANSSKATPTEGPKEIITMVTLPMTSTSSPKVRFVKRDVASVQFTGPNAHYMSSLARLFDAAQVIDLIARQVEDPGLRHADKTQVGLELCTRHAAEFFGFYICRFVLNDVGLFLDKFIKRGSEWVLV